MASIPLTTKIANSNAVQMVTDVWRFFFRPNTRFTFDIGPGFDVGTLE